MYFVPDLQFLSLPTACEKRSRDELRASGNVTGQCDLVDTDDSSTIAD
ncbi:MAG: hypothetical protein Ct9H300mP25_03150 [Acidobacteriota bacterium]|nr:MAG: hypothetical protein Ct9H300mP25_03150 [Acidobacteriota bacterium]